MPLPVNMPRRESKNYGCHDGRQGAGDDQSKVQHHLTDSLVDHSLERFLYLAIRNSLHCHHGCPRLFAPPSPDLGLSGPEDWSREV